MCVCGNSSEFACARCGLASVGFSFGIYNTYRWWCCLQVEGEPGTNINKHAKRKLETMINVDPHMTWLSRQALGPATLKISENFTAPLTVRIHLTLPHLVWLTMRLLILDKLWERGALAYVDCNARDLHPADSFDRKPSSGFLFGFFAESSRDFKQSCLPFLICW